MAAMNEPSSLAELPDFASGASTGQAAAWFQQAQAGTMSWTEVAERILAWQHSAALAGHRPDVDRRRRCGAAEVIFGQHKRPEDIVAIAARLLASGEDEILVTRVDVEAMRAIVPAFNYSRYDCLGRTLRLSDTLDLSDTLVLSQAVPGTTESLPPCPAPPSLAPHVVVVTAGSTDLPVAREALETLRWMRVECSLITDVGVAGPYRLLPHLPRLRAATALVVVAGMEGALASVAGGLVDCPIIAVPTSIGYGANLQGITTLLSMISSCAAGVTTVNIDGGFKGGYVAGLIARKLQQHVDQLAQAALPNQSVSGT